MIYDVGYMIYGVDDGVDDCVMDVRSVAER